LEVAPVVSDPSAIALRKRLEQEEVSMLETMFSAQARKFWVAVIAVVLAGLTQLQSVMADGMTPDKWITVAIAVIGCAAVYVAKNEPAKG